jgi:hypothetical protein
MRCDAMAHHEDKQKTLHRSAGCFSLSYCATASATLRRSGAIPTVLPISWQIFQTTANT